MKKTALLLSIVCILSCNGQNNKSKNMLNLEYLKKNAAVSEISYNGAVSTSRDTGSTGIKHYILIETKDDSKTTIEGDQEIGYKKTTESTDFVEHSEYDKNGILQKNVKQSVYGFYIYSIDFDKNGKVSKEINYDSLFKFTTQDLFNYMKRYGFNLDKKSYQQISDSESPRPMILRGQAEEFKFLIPELDLKEKLIWLIVNVEGRFEDRKGIYFVCLDGTTGKEILRKEYLGKKSGKNGVGTYPNYKVISSN